MIRPISELNIITLKKGMARLLGFKSYSMQEMTLID